LKQSGKQELVLSQADQLILEAINKTNERIDNLSKEFTGRIDNLSGELTGRIDNLSGELTGRIDTLWITMLGGFMGVMAFIGGIVFWDRRTFLKRAREECRHAIIEEAFALSLTYQFMVCFELFKKYFTPHFRANLSSCELIVSYI